MAWPMLGILIAWRRKFLELPSGSAKLVLRVLSKFHESTLEDLEDRMDVDVWVEKIKEMGNVEITECSYNMEALLGK